MQTIFYSSAPEFLSLHGPHLLAREAENVLMVSLLQRLASGSYRCDNPSLLAVVLGLGKYLVGPN